jgi:hypothetical protein
MMDEEAAILAQEALHNEFMECIGVEDFLNRVYSGREKGLLQNIYVKDLIAMML